MRRHFFRPFFDFPEPFLFNRVFMPRFRARVIRVPQNQVRNQYERPTSHQIFEEFFNQQGIKTQAQKQFFQKNFPEKVANNQKQVKCPYKILGLQKNATEDQVNEAYRSLALKYHPKADPSQEAAKKFEEISEAYQQIRDKDLQPRNEGTISTRSFFDDFQKDIDQFFDVFNEPIQQVKQANQNVKSQKSQAKEKPIEQKSDFYSQSSYIENRNGKNEKVIIEKKYTKDGKILTVKREENFKNDGTKEVTETIDDGKQIKKKVFIEGEEKKAIA